MKNPYHKLWYTALITFSLLITGCQPAPQSHFTAGKPRIIATTAAWALVANAITDRVFTVDSIVNSATNPHEFTPSPVNELTLNQADIIIANGGGYDDILLTGLSHPEHVINAFTVAHKSPQANSHVFLDLPTVLAVAQNLTQQLNQLDPQDSAAFTRNLRTFTDQIHALIHRLAIMHQRHRPSYVVQTESIASYILALAHIIDLTPSHMLEDKTPSTEDLHTVTELITHKKISALIINPHAQNTRTDNCLSLARTSGVPVVDFSESPDKYTSYITWINSMITPLALAVRD